MTERGERMDPERPIDFFISYSPADERWASWIAWQLEAAGYRTLIQAWDFVPGTNFIDFMNRGVREAAVVVAVLSRNYLTSRYGTLEWQATLRTDAAKLVTVRIEDCPVDGLLATVTWVDLVNVADEHTAHQVLLGRLRETLDGRAKPAVEPSFPVGTVQRPEPPRAPAVAEPSRTRRTPLAAPDFPPDGPAERAGRDSVTVLHVPGPRFGRGTVAESEPLTARELQSRIRANVSRLTDSGVPAPELIVVSGDVTESARPAQIDEALNFLAGLRVLLGLEPHRLIVVPGRRDVSKPACHAYFLQCEARDRPPQEPYFPKLDHFAELFAELYQGLDGLVFDIAQPWTLFTIPELRVAVAGMNSTMAISHRPEDDYGQLGEAQAAWFAERLRPFESAGWLRLGVLGHDPTPGGRLPGPHPVLLRDAELLDRLLASHLNLVLHGPGPGGTRIDVLDSGLPAVSGAGPGRDEIIQLTAEGLRRFSVHEDRIGERAEWLARTWHAVGATFASPHATGLAELDAQVPEPEPELVPASDPHGRLLDRVVEVCAVRYPDAKVRRIEAKPPHLLLTRVDAGITAQWRVGAHAGEVTREVLDDFLQHDPDPGSELVFQGQAPARSLRDEAARRGVRLRSFTEFQGLLDLDDYVARQTLRLHTDPRYPPDLYVPQRFHCSPRPTPMAACGCGTPPVARRWGS